MKRNYYIVSLIMLTFFVISFITMIIGPLIPDIIKEFNLQSYAGGASFFCFFFIAYGGDVEFPTGMLVEKYKEKKIMITGFIVAFFGALLLALIPNYFNSSIISFYYWLWNGYAAGCIISTIAYFRRRRTLCFYSCIGAINFWTCILH